MKTEKQIILFDGVCNLCNGFVNFIIDRDPTNKFLFGSLQSDEAKKLLSQFPQSKHNIDSLSTVMLIKGNVLYSQSTAVLHILRALGGAWPVLYIFIIVPSFLRDTIYSWVARNRYKWFGRRETCRIPTPELKTRFIS